MSQSPTPFDSPWKDAIERYFEDFILFFFPQAHGQISWSRGYEFLDKELQQVVRDAELGLRLADKLVKIWRTGGEEAWVLIHVEVQRVVSQKQVGGKVGKPKTSNPVFPMSTPSLFKWRHFLPENILLNVRWYCRYPLSYRNLEEMMQGTGCGSGSCHH